MKLADETLDSQGQVCMALHMCSTAIGLEEFDFQAFPKTRAVLSSPAVITFLPPLITAIHKIASW